MRTAMTTIRVATLFVSLAATVATGCWNAKEEISSAVWSDDDTEQAYQKLLFEQNSANPNPLIGSNRRNFRYQIYVQRPDGSGRRAVSGIREGTPGGFFFYMRNAGYVLLNVLEGGGNTRLDLIRTATTSATVLRRLDVANGPVNPCQGLEALPSPDGRTIAVIERRPPTSGGCNGGLVAVDLVDAATLAIDASFEWSLNGMPAATWTRGGDLIVWTYAGGSWRVDPISGPVPTSEPTCTHPRTSSSNVSEDGVWIAGGTLEDPIDVLQTGAENCW